MSSRVKTLLLQGGGIILAVVLLYLALRGVDLAAMGTALRHADYRWLLPLVAIALGSHLLRAWRWNLLLGTLPDHPSRKVLSLEAAFSSVMIGYMVNYAASRFGEVARAGNLAARQALPFSSVLGTVAAERLLDVATLALGLASAFILLIGRMDVLNNLLFAPAALRLNQLPYDTLTLIIAIALLCALFIWAGIKVSGARLSNIWSKQLKPALSSFKEGFMTLRQCPHRLALVGSTIAIWTGYLFMGYIPLLMLGLAGTYDLSLVDGWIIFLMGSLGIVVPSPGGTGSYHYITIATLQHLFGVARSPAATYAVLTHAAQLVLYTSVGFICLLAQGTSFSALRKQSRKAQEASE